ncbi:MAG: hypothetical protein WCJ74_01860 [bacterium]
MLRKAGIVIKPKTGKPGKIQLNTTCLITDVLEIIKRLGFVPTPHDKMHPELAKGQDNIVISIHRPEPHPKNNKPSFPGYITGGGKIHMVIGENETLPMLTEIAVSQAA